MDNTNINDKTYTINSNILTEEAKNFLKNLKNDNDKTYFSDNNKGNDPTPERLCNQPILNFYGCAFNFSKDSAAEARYYYGDDVYLPNKGA